jgi:hypothetical protein
MSAGNVRGRAKPNQEFFVSFLRTKGHTNHGKALGVLAATHTFSAKNGLGGHGDWNESATSPAALLGILPAMLAPGLGSGNRAICGIQTVSRALSRDV